MNDDDGPSTDNDALYEAMRRRGAGRITAGRIANAQPVDDAAGGSQLPYERRTRKELYERAKKLGIPGRSSMSKQALITALRSN